MHYHIFMIPLKKNSKKFSLLLWAVAFCLLLFYSGQVSAEEPQSSQELQPQQQVQIVETPETLLEDAETAVEQENIEKGARLFLRIHKKFPNAPQAEESFWKGAQLYKKVSLASAEPNWEQVRDLFRKFGLDYPESQHATEAYFEVGVAHFYMRFFREALTYFKLFAERYPESSLVPRARYWQARTLFEIGRLDEAIKMFQELVKTKDRDFQIQVLLRLGEAFDAKKDYRRALKSYTDIMTKYPKYYFGDFDLLINLGKAYFKVGKEEPGRKQLFYYLNVAEPFPRKAEVLFELAESFLRQEIHATAQKLYARVVEEGRAGERAVVLTLFRQAEYLDDPDRKLSKWQKRGDLTDPAGDQPYLAVLDSYHAESIAQDVRYGLFLRYKARDNFEYASEMGKGYLRYDSLGITAARKPDSAGQVLIYLAEELLKRKEYQKIYELYHTDYRHVVKYKQGRLLYLVGQALEALSLYKQAAVVYYRALGLPLSDKDKVDLYYRRVEVYLALKDWVSADRLLKHLRNIYKGKKEAGEVYYLSGRLYEEQGRVKDALPMYDKAITILTLPDKKHLYGKARLRTLFALEKYEEVLDGLDKYKKEGWLSGEDLQHWYVKMGDVLRRHDDKQAAVDVYLSAVDENMPQSGEVAQNIHLYLGDLFFNMGKMEKSRFYFLKAASGTDSLWQELARERLNQVDINQTVSDIGSLLD